ncbi:MAG TPA: DUF4446 family protein [Firmicutes bacterium]|nr:DUF4446 family protein [Bacillota bacterium]
MEATFFSKLSPEESMGFIILVVQGLFLFLLLINGIRLHKLIKRYRSLLAGNQGKNLEEILLGLGERMKNAEASIANMETKIARMEAEATQYMQRWALQRYKAFANIGGEQSFSFVLLDRNGDGVMISSIHGRDESRVYAKSISAGKANYPLSDEEQEVLAAAIKKRN